MSEKWGIYCATHKTWYRYTVQLENAWKIKPIYPFSKTEALREIEIIRRQTPELIFELRCNHTSNEEGKIK